MPVYAYRGKSRAGVEVRGEREADTKQALLAALRREQISPLMVKEKGKELSLPKLGGKVKTKELAIFTRQFSVMIDAGLPLVQCLEALAQQQENKVFAGVLQAVRTEVEGGSTLAYAMSQHPKVFDSSLHQHDRSWRSGRYSRHNPSAPFLLHRKGSQAEDGPCSRPWSIQWQFCQSPSASSS